MRIVAFRVDLSRHQVERILKIFRKFGYIERTNETCGYRKKITSRSN